MENVNISHARQKKIKLLDLRSHMVLKTVVINSIIQTVTCFFIININQTINRSIN